MAVHIKPILITLADGVTKAPYVEQYDDVSGNTRYFYAGANGDGRAFAMSGAAPAGRIEGLVEVPEDNLPKDANGRTILPTSQFPDPAGRTTGNVKTLPGSAPAAAPGKQPGNAPTAAAASGNPNYSAITAAGTAETAANYGADFAYRLGTGQSIDTDTGLKTPDQILRAAAGNGNPVGLAYKDTLSNNRARQLQLASAAPSHALASQGAAGLASGQTAAAAQAPAQQAYSAAATAGNQNFNAAGTGVSGVLGTAANMSGDINNLRQAAAGAVPSAAELQQRRGISDAVAAQQSAAATVRGGNAAAALRQAAGAGSSIMSRGIGDAAQLRAQEQATARGQLTQAQQTQGALYGTGAQVATGVGSAQANRALDVAAGRTALGNSDLASRAQGTSLQGQQAAAELDAAKARVAQEQSDREMYLNSYLQWLATLQGNAPSAITGATQRAIAAQQQSEQERAALTNAFATSVATGATALSDRNRR